jgi:hypothetical protein
MTTRAQRQRERIARLLDQVQRAADAWAAAEYQVGIATGRRGAVSAPLETIRATAERRFRDLAAKLAAAGMPPAEPGRAQRRLPLA